MVPNMKLLLIILLMICSTTVLAKEKSDKKIVILNETYRKSQREFNRKNYKKALPLLEKYLELSKIEEHKRERLFWVIDQIGRIHLRVNRNPDMAIQFFEKMILNDDRLSEAEEDDIGAWISAAKDWKKYGISNPKKLSSNKLYSEGKKYYKLGEAKLNYPADDVGNAFFSIATTYLVPFIVNYDKSPKIGEALLMMGKIRHHLRTDPEYWNDNYYLKEVIRRFPRTKLARKAWKLLDLDVRVGYTGSSGDHTPDGLVKMLDRYKKLAFSKNTR